MKVFKNVLIGLTVFLIVMLGIGFFLPAHVDVQRSLLIHATPGQIHPFVENLKRWNDWMPWNKEMDSTIVYSYAGSDKGEGAQMSWQAKKMGVGTLVILKSEPKAGIWYSIDFNQGKMFSQGTIAYEPVAKGTKVIWTGSMNLGNNPIYRYLGLLMDAILRADFNQGLAKLKQVVEIAQVEKAK